MHRSGSTKEITSELKTKPEKPSKMKHGGETKKAKRKKRVLLTCEKIAEVQYTWSSRKKEEVTKNI